jgi:hypothetical protein
MPIQEEPINTDDISQLKVIHGYMSILKGSGDGILHIPLKVSEL